MTTALMFVVLAGSGAVLRALVGSRLNQTDGVAVGTMAVNVLGSLVLGLLHRTSGPVATIFGVGFCGAFTTMSSFARDVVVLFETRRFVQVFGYCSGTLLLGLGGAAAGVAMSGAF